MPSKLVSNLDEVKGITAFTFVANRIIGKNILSHLCVKLALMPLEGEGRASAELPKILDDLNE